MKNLKTSWKLLASLAISVLVASCATDYKEKQNTAAASGFKVITPKGPDQQAILAKLPPRQVTQVTYKGKRYYVLPDAAHNQAYVGGQAEYQAYRQARQQQHISDENLEAAQINQMNS